MRRLLLSSVVGLILVLVAVAPFLAAASPITFGHTWGTNVNERATAVVVDSSGNVFLGGAQQNQTNLMENAFVAKFTSAGTLAWNRVFPFASNASLDLSLAPGGDVYALGTEIAPGSVSSPNFTFNGSIPSGFVARISSAGALVFMENLTQIWFPQRIATDPSTGGFVISGFDVAAQQTVVAAFTSTGTLRWAESVSSSSTFPGPVAVDSSGNVYAFIGRDNGDSALDKFTTNGTLVGQVVIGSFSTTYVYPADVIITSAGPLVLGSGPSIVFLSQLTSSLSSSWIEAAQGIGWQDFPTRLVELSDGSFVSLDTAYATFNSTVSANVYHFSSTGAVVSGSSYVSPAESQGLGQGFATVAGAGLSNGGLVLAGYTLGVTPSGSTAVNVTTSVPATTWAPDNLVWTPMSLAVTPQSVALLNPTVPVDNWNELAGLQAWYGETSLPPSKLTVTVGVSQSTPSSPSVTLSTTVSGGKKPYSYSWSFGDGTFGSGSATPSHTYPGVGRYLAQVTVTDSSGNVGYGSGIVTVTGPPSILSLAQYPSGTVDTGTYVSFSANAVDPDGGTISTYTWNFGDGAVDVTTYPSDSHIYGFAGNFTMTLTVTDSDQGLSVSQSMTVTVVPRPDSPPVAEFFWSPFQPTVGTYAFFYGYNSFDPDGFITNYAWNFGDGSSANASGCCPAHVYNAVGNYTVTLTVTDNAGLTNTTSATIAVVPDVPPIADFFWSPQVPSMNQTVFFNGGYYSYDPDGYIVSWDWNFGDGTTGGGGNQTGNQTGNNTNLGPYPTHTYTTFGTFDVTLTVTDNAGLSTSVSKSIYVNAPPMARFTTSESIAKAGTPLTLNGNASTDPDGDPLTYNWFFGDGSSASGAVVSHVFAVPDQYLVTLVVSDPYTSASTAQYIPVVVPKTPVAVMAWSPTHPVTGQTVVSFSGSSSFDPDGAITQYIWEFGDGTLGSGATTTHVYGSAGTYVLELIVIDEDGMSNRDVQSITVVAPSKGTVTTASASNPAAGAIVDLTYDGAPALALTTAADGSFSLGGLAPGTYGITITLAGYAPYVGTLAWDGVHGNLGTFVLKPLATSGSGALGFVTSPTGVIALAVAAVAGIGAGAYVVRRRRARDLGRQPPR